MSQLFFQIFGLIRDENELCELRDNLIYAYRKRNREQLKLLQPTIHDFINKVNRSHLFNLTNVETISFTALIFCANIFFSKDYLFMSNNHGLPVRCVMVTIITMVVLSQWTSDAKTFGPVTWLHLYLLVLSVSTPLIAIYYARTPYRADIAVTYLMVTGMFTGLKVRVWLGYVVLCLIISLIVGFIEGFQGWNQGFFAFYDDRLSGVSNYKNSLDSYSTDRDHNRMQFITIITGGMLEFLSVLLIVLNGILLLKSEAVTFVFSMCSSPLNSWRLMYGHNSRPEKLIHVLIMNNMVCGISKQLKSTSKMANWEMLLNRKLINGWMPNYKEVYNKEFGSIEPYTNHNSQSRDPLLPLCCSDHEEIDVCDDKSMRDTSKIEEDGQSISIEASTSAYSRDVAEFIIQDVPIPDTHLLGEFKDRNLARNFKRFIKVIYIPLLWHFYHPYSFVFLVGILIQEIKTIFIMGNMLAIYDQYYAEWANFEEESPYVSDINDFLIKDLSSANRLVGSAMCFSIGIFSSIVFIIIFTILNIRRGKVKRIKDMMSIVRWGYLGIAMISEALHMACIRKHFTASSNYEVTIEFTSPIIFWSLLMNCLVHHIRSSFSDHVTIAAILIATRCLIRRVHSPISNELGQIITIGGLIIVSLVCIQKHRRFTVTANIGSLTHILDQLIMANKWRLKQLTQGALSPKESVVPHEPR